MKVLFISPFSCVPPNSGNKNLTFNLLKYLTPKIHVDLIALEDPNDLTSVASRLIQKEFPNLNSLRVIRKPTGMTRLARQLSFLSQGYHPALGRYASDEVTDILKSANADRAYNVVHFDMVHVAPYRTYIPDVPALLVSSDAYSLAAARAIALYTRRFSKLRAWLEYALIRRFEGTRYAKFDVVATVSDVDALYLRNAIEGGRLATIGLWLGQ